MKKASKKKYFQNMSAEIFLSLSYPCTLPFAFIPISAQMEIN